MLVNGFALFFVGLLIFIAMILAFVAYAYVPQTPPQTNGVGTTSTVNAKSLAAWSGTLDIVALLVLMILGFMGWGVTDVSYGGVDFSGHVKTM